MIIWQYWENAPNTNKPGIIDFCMQSVHKNSGMKVNIITPDNIYQYFEKKEILEEIFDLEFIAQRVDYIRIKALYKYGGIWLDSDTICTNKIYIEGKDLIIYKLEDTIINPIIISQKKHNQILGIYLKKMQQKIKNEIITLNTLGELLLTSIIKQYSDSDEFEIRDSKNIYPIPWYDNIKWTQFYNGKITEFISHSQQIIILAYQSLHSNIKQYNRQQFNEYIQNSNCLLSQSIKHFPDTESLIQSPLHLDKLKETFQNIKNEMQDITIDYIPKYFHKSVVIIEPRSHPDLEVVIKNTLYHLGKDWGLQIFHGNLNLKYVQQIVNTLGKNNFIHLHDLKIDNLEPYSWQYENLKKSPEFWEKVKGEYCLMVEPDTVIRKFCYIERFFKYDYIGAPWKPHIWGENRPPDYWVGNSGLSIMRKSVFLKVCQERKQEAKKILQDDIFWHFFIKNIASVEDAKQFSVETTYYPDPFGLHKPYLYLDDVELRPLLQELTFKPKYNIAMVNIYQGKLPEYLKFFLLSTKHLHKYNIEIWIIHTEEETFKNTSNVKFIHLNTHELATRIYNILPKYYQYHFSTSNIRDNMIAAKCNDYKILIGSLFASELRDYTHWGWIDIDLCLGDLSTLMNQLEYYDIVTYPDALLNFGYLSGQFTVIKNNDKYNNSWKNPCIIQGTEQKSILHLILESYNQITDEMYAIHYLGWETNTKILCDFNQCVSCAPNMHGSVRFVDSRILIQGDIITKRKTSKKSYPDNSYYTQDSKNKKSIKSYLPLNITHNTFLTITEYSMNQIIDEKYPMNDKGYYHYSIFHFHQLKSRLNSTKILFLPEKQFISFNF